MVVWRFGDRPGEPRSERAQPARPLRIVSLVPSLTELLFELGLGPQVVGRTGFCVHPANAVRAVPKVGGTKSVDVDAVLALSPTHLIVNVDENERPTVERLARDVPEVVVTHPLTLADNLALYAGFGERFGREREARGLADRLNDARQALAAARCRLPDLEGPLDDRCPRYLYRRHACASRIACAGARVAASVSASRLGAMAGLGQRASVALGYACAGVVFK